MAAKRPLIEVRLGRDQKLLRVLASGVTEKWGPVASGIGSDWARAFLTDDEKDRLIKKLAEIAGAAQVEV